MKVDLKNGQPALESDISALEVLIGQPLDTQFRKFLEMNNGAYPGENSFPVADVAHVGGVTQFIPIHDIVRERSYIDDIPPRAYPVASSEGGNYVILDQDRGGAIFFWDHEVEGAISRIADSFDDFLNIIVPFDDSSVHLSPGRVRSVWIDPDFLKQLNE